MLGSWAIIFHRPYPAINGGLKQHEWVTPGKFRKLNGGIVR
jgi:hypothetical protein